MGHHPPHNMPFVLPIGMFFVGQHLNTDLPVMICRLGPGDRSWVPGIIPCSIFICQCSGNFLLGVLYIVLNAIHFLMHQTLRCYLMWSYTDNVIFSHIGLLCVIESQRSCDNLCNASTSLTATTSSYITVPRTLLGARTCSMAAATCTIWGHQSPNEHTPNGHSILILAFVLVEMVVCIKIGQEKNELLPKWTVDTTAVWFPQTSC